MPNQKEKVMLILRRSLTVCWLVTRPDWAGDGERRLGGPPASQSVLSYDELQSACRPALSGQVL